MASDPEHRLLVTVTNNVAGVTVVLAGIQSDVQVQNVQLSVVVSAADEEASGRIVDFLPKNQRRIAKIKLLNFTNHIVTVYWWIYKYSFSL